MSSQPDPVAGSNAAVEAYHRALKGLVRALAYLAGAGLMAMVLVTTADVVLRVFNAPLTGAYDIVKIAAAITVAAALPYTTAIKGHVAIEFFFHKLGRRGRIVVDALMRSAGHGPVRLAGLGLRRLRQFAAPARRSQHDPAVARFLGPLRPGRFLRPGRADQALPPDPPRQAHDQAMSPTEGAFIGFALLLLLLAGSMPVGFVMAAVGLVGFALMVSPQAAFSMATIDLYTHFLRLQPDHHPAVYPDGAGRLSHRHQPRSV